MLKMNYDLEGALREYLVLLDEKKYFEAHEVLEEAWHPLRLADHSLKNLLKGLINGAIAFEHLKRNQAKAHDRARRVIVSFDRYQYLCTDRIEHAALFMRACEKIETVKKIHNDVFGLNMHPEYYHAETSLAVRT